LFVGFSPSSITFFNISWSKSRVATSTKFSYSIFIYKLKL